MALLGFPVAAGVPAAGESGAGAGPFLAVADPHASPHEVHAAVFDWVLALLFGRSGGLGPDRPPGSQSDRRGSPNVRLAEP